MDQHKMDEVTAMRICLRDMLVDVLTSPVALDRRLAVEIVQNILITHGWCIRENTAEMIKEQYKDPATPPPAEYMDFLINLATRERTETALTVRDLSKAVNGAMEIPPRKTFN